MNHYEHFRPLRSCSPHFLKRNSKSEFLTGPAGHQGYSPDPALLHPACGPVLRSTKPAPSPVHDAAGPDGRGQPPAPADRDILTGRADTGTPYIRIQTEFSGVFFRFRRNSFSGVFSSFGLWVLTE